jgi:hypothetical protein
MPADPCCHLTPRCHLFTRGLVLAAVGGLLWLTFAQQSSRSSAQPAAAASNTQPAGDGETDDTSALQQQIDAGGGLHLPAGAYRLTKSLVVNLDEVGHWSLHGHGVARLVMEGAGPAIKVVGTHGGTAAPRTVKPEVWDRQRMPLVDGIEIVGRHEEACGIELTGTMQPTITRVTVRDCLHAIHITERNRNVQISDCHLYDNRGIGVFLDGVNLHQINVVGCHISYNAGGGIVARKSEIRNLQVGTCDIEGNMGGPDSPSSANIDLDSTDSSVAEVAIVGCTIQHAPDAPDSANIRINGRSTPRPFTDEVRHGHVTIADNVLSDVQTNIELRHVRGGTITGNTMWKGFTHNLLLVGCDSLIVSGNNLDDNPRYNYGDGGTAKLAVVLQDCTDCIFSDNILKGIPHNESAVTLTGCRWTTISGCQIFDYDGWGLTLKDCEQCRVINCSIADRRADDPTARAIRVEGGTNVTALNLIGE